ncbi:thioredoxin domain-containing protein [Emticicia fontis]
MFLLYGFITLSSYGQKLKSDNTSKFNFSDLSQNKASIIVFFDIDCPICEKYTKLLKEINQKYSPLGIGVYVVYPHKYIDLNAINSFKKDFQFELPIYFDKKRELLHRLGGSVTPEVFLLNNLGVTVYHGAIDNWFYSLGKNRAQATENYLLDTIEALIKGESVKINYHEAIGCAL